MEHIVSKTLKAMRHNALGSPIRRGTNQLCQLPIKRETSAGIMDQACASSQAYVVGVDRFAASVCISAVTPPSPFPILSSSIPRPVLPSDPSYPFALILGPETSTFVLDLLLALALYILLLNPYASISAPVVSVLFSSLLFAVLCCSLSIAYTYPRARHLSNIPSHPRDQIISHTQGSFNRCLLFTLCNKEHTYTPELVFYRSHNHHMSIT